MTNRQQLLSRRRQRGLAFRTFVVLLLLSFGAGAIWFAHTKRQETLASRTRSPGHASFAPKDGEFSDRSSIKRPDLYTIQVKGHEFSEIDLTVIAPDTGQVLTSMRVPPKRLSSLQLPSGRYTLSLVYLQQSSTTPARTLSIPLSVEFNSVQPTIDLSYVSRAQLPFPTVTTPSN